MLRIVSVNVAGAVATLRGHIGPVTSCAVTPDGRKVVSGSDDHTLKVWELASGCAVATLQGHTGWVGACAVTADGRHAISASKDKTLTLKGELPAESRRRLDRVDSIYDGGANVPPNVQLGAG